jgi:hypothetical protein
MLRAAADDEPPQGSLTALAAALGVAPTLTGLSWLGSASSTAASSGAAGASGAAGLGSSVSTAVGAVGATSAASSLTALLVAKYVAIGMASGLVAMGGITLAGESREAARKDTLHTSPAKLALAANRAAPERSGSAAERASAPQVEAPAVAVDPAEPRPKLPARGAIRARQLDESQARAAEATAPSGVASASAAAFVDESAKPVEAVEQNKGLTRELALLDRARSTLLGGNPSEALKLLDQYRRVRVSMILDPEAEALRILALDRLGQHQMASRLAREFIASHPASRQVDSLRALAEAER